MAPMVPIRTMNVLRTRTAIVIFQPSQTLSAEELQSFCRGKIMNYKIPHYTKFVDDFPKTVTGKVQKYKMREISAAELGLGQPVKQAA